MELLPLLYGLFHCSMFCRSRIPDVLYIIIVTYIFSVVVLLLWNYVCLHYDRPFSIYDISYLWFGLIGMVISLVCGIIISFVTGPFCYTHPQFQCRSFLLYTS